MKRFLVGKIGGELQGSANIVNREIVLTPDLFESHAPAKLTTTTVTGTRVPRITGLP